MSFDIELPSSNRPYAIYKNSFQGPKYFLEQIEKLKTEMKAFQFIVARKKPAGDILFNTNIRVTLEEYTISEEAKEGFDVKVKIKLKQYREYKTKTMKISTKQNKKVAKKKANTRETNTAPKTKKYAVKKGDCLWSIAKKFYGDGNKYKRIYEANKSKIKKPSLIYPRASIYNSIGRCINYE